MGLALYRRHRRECKSGHSEELRTSEYDERKKGWKRCDCPIFLSGTLSRKFARQTTGQWEWEAARAIAAKFEVSGRWAADPVLEPSRHSATPERVTIGEAIEAFLAKCKSRDIQPTTFAKYQPMAVLVVEAVRAPAVRLRLRAPSQIPNVTGR
jgi:hypothetical protein